MNTDLIVALQRGLPLVRRPFAALGSACGMAENDVLAQVITMFAQGTARRLGAVFDARRLGYQSTLCALLLPPEERDAVAARIVPHSGVTHCYLRGWPADLDPHLPSDCRGESLPNLWFTLAAPVGTFDAARTQLREAVAPHAMLDMPARRRFKIDVVFNPATRASSEHIPPLDPSDASVPLDVSVFSPQDRALVRRLQGSLPLEAEPFAAVARELGWDADTLVARLNAWQANGVLRRVALIVRHRLLGFKANGMCVWHVAESDVVAAGRILAAQPEVTHCYERACDARFVYNLYAMIHTGTWLDTQALFQRIADMAALRDGRLLCSIKEYKKTSPEYFKES